MASKQFEYFAEITHLDLIELEDIGNCAIIAFNDIGEEYILIIRTQLGRTKILQLGPIIIDLEILPKEVNCILKTIDFNEKKISKIIKQFLNNYKAHITQAVEVELDNAIKDCKNLIDYIKSDIF